MEEPKFEQVPEETAGAPAEPAALPAADEALIPEMPEEPAAPAEDPMVEVCDVQFRSGSKVYFFAPGELKIATGDEVILETARGPEFGQCVRGNHMVHPREVTPPLRPILRLATQQDKRVHAENCRREKRAMDVCQQKIADLGLEMQLVSAEYAFDGSKMAKTQNLSLNPTKISGTCGRLMCCLNYEQETYEELLKTSPKNESFVDTPDGRGTVTEVNLLKQCVRVRLEQQPDTIVCHHNCDICVLRNGKARKTDPPIPDDLAPISGNPQKCRKKEAPELKTYLEPVVMRQNAAVLEEARTNEADIQNEQQRGKRRRRGGRGRRHEGEGEVPQEQETRRPAEAKKPAEPKKPAESKKPAEARKLAEARPEQAEGELKKQRPRRQRPPRAPKPEGEKPPRAEAAPVDAPHGGDKPKPRRRSRGHRKPGGPKPEGGGEV